MASKEQRPNRIRELRDERDLTVRDLAIASGIDFSTLNRFERGTQPLDYPRMRIIARALGVRVSELLNDEDVELRANSTGQAILAELRDIQPDQLAHALTATREVMRVARALAATQSAGALGGDITMIRSLADLWSGWDDDERAKKVELWALTDRAK